MTKISQTSHGGTNIGHADAVHIHGVVDGFRPRSTLLDLGEIVGRARDLSVITTAFADPQQPARLVLAGNPGWGKTHLANAYGARNVSRYLGGTFFIPFNADPVLRLAKLVPAMPDETESIAERATRFLESVSKPTLIIYDNVPTEDELVGWLPPAGLPIHLLVTSTSQDWSRLHTVHRLDAMSEGESRDLVTRLTGEESARKYSAALLRRAAGVIVRVQIPQDDCLSEGFHGVG